MIDDYDIDDLVCPKCGQSPIHSRRCTEPECEDGQVDESDEDFLLSGTNLVSCTECHGTGIVRWCPNCGADLSQERFEQDEDKYDDMLPLFPSIF